MKKSIILILSGILLSTNLLFSQGGNFQGKDMPKEASLKGTVIDNELNTPVEYASVALFSVRDSSLITGTITDNTGNFVLSELPYGRFYVLVNFIGYEKLRVNDVRLIPTNKDVVLSEIRLHQSVSEIQEVEVVAQKSYVEYKIDKKVVNVSQHINAQSGTAANVLENVPSVQVDLEGNVTLRGSSNFTVLIDGKPTVLSGNDILQQTPASVIENIEIITNPSAKYDPEGTTGIINLVLKKQKKAGFSGIINANAGTGNKYGGDFLLNFRREKFNFYTGANYRMSQFYMDGNTERITYGSTDTTYLNTIDKRNMGHSGGDIKAGIDLYIDNNTTLSLAGSVGISGFERGSFTKYQNYSYLNPDFIYYTADNERVNTGKYYTSTVSFQRKFAKPEHKLDINAFFSQNLGGSESFVNQLTTNAFYVPDNSDTTMNRQDEVKNELRGRLNIDYVYPVTDKTRLEFGYQTELINSKSDYVFEDFINATWNENLDYTNELLFNRNIQAIYGTFKSEIAGWGYQLGLRGEYTNRLIKQVTTDKDYLVKGLGYFPTVHISRELKGQQQIQFGYSRRLNRPREYFLNPYPMYSDGFTRMQGNPMLDDEYTGAYEINYQKRFNQSFVSIETFYRNSTNEIERISKMGDDGVLEMTFANISAEQSFGAEAMANLMLKKWLNLNISMSASQYNISGDLDGEVFDKNSFNYDGRGNITFMPTMLTRIQLNAMYRSGGVTAQGTENGMFMTSLAVRQDLFKRKLTVVVDVRDIFGTGVQEGTTETANYYNYFYQKRESPVFSISLSYKINNYKTSEKRPQNQEMQFDEF